MTILGKKTLLKVTVLAVVMTFILSGCKVKGQTTTGNLDSSSNLDSSVSETNQEKVEKAIDFYATHSDDPSYYDEMTDQFYALYTTIPFEELIELNSTYSHYVQNRVSSFLIYGIYQNEGDFKSLTNQLEKLNSEKTYAYLSERLKSDYQLDTPEKLNLEDDQGTSIDEDELEKSIMTAHSIDELIQLSLNYSLDGAFSEGFAARLSELLKSEGIDAFISDAIGYGAPIQDEIASELAYDIGYDEEAVQALLENLQTIELNDKNRHFVEKLQEELTAAY